MSLAGWSMLCIAAAGCEKPDATPSASGSTAPRASAAANSARAATPTTKSTPPPAEGGGKGLSAANNDPALVALAKTAQACKNDGGYLDFSCPGVKAWYDSKEAQAPTAAPTLINFIEDDDEKVRALGAMQLSKASKGYGGDKALAERVIAAAEKETAKTMDPEVYGYGLGDIDLASTGLLDRLKAAFPKLASDGFRKGVLKKVLWTNKTDPVADWLLELTKDPSKVVRVESIGAFFTSGGFRVDDSCKAAIPLMKDAEVEVRIAAATVIAGTTGCESATYDPFLDGIEATYKEGKLNGNMASKLSMFQKAKKAPTPEQVKRAQELIRAIVTDSKVPSSTRTALMGAVAFDDKEFAKQILPKLESDADAQVAAKAKELSAAP